MDGIGRFGFGTTDDGSVADAAPATNGDRRRKRDSLFLTAQLTIAGDPGPVEVRVRNLSEGGLMIESERVVAQGTAVALQVRGVGDVTGEVAWCTAGRIGVAFDRRIDPRRARKPVGNGARTPDYAKPLLHCKAPPRR